MTKKELEVICKELTDRIRELEDPAHPDDPYIYRILKAFKWMEGAEKNEIAKKCEGFVISKMRNPAINRLQEALNGEYATAIKQLKKE